MSEIAVAATIKDMALKWVRMEAVDVDGVVRGKRIRADRFLESLAGSPITDTHFSMSVAEEYTSLSGPWAEGVLGDLLLVPDLSTFKDVPWETGVAAVMCDWRTASGQQVAVAPRTVLADQVERLASLGFVARAALEYELWLFRESPESAAAKGWRDLTPLFPGKRSNDALRSADQHALFGDIFDQISSYGVTVDEVKVETGASQIEVNLAPAPILEACDRASRLRLSLKELLRRRNILPIFLARPADVDMGASSHLHLSLWDNSKETPLFWDADRDDGMSDLMRHAVGGLLATLIPLLPMFCPTINSGKRLREFVAVPTAVSWGHENKSVAVRTTTRSAGATRIEHRLAGADANPYLVAAAALAGIRHGIDGGIEPPAPVAAFAWGDKSLEPLPRTLREAVKQMEASPLPAELLDPAFVSHFLATRHFELRRYDEATTDWELQRYSDRI